MQLWFLSPDPRKSAQILYEKSPRRARKQVIEFMQACAVLCEKHGLPLPIKKDGTLYKTKLASRFPKPLMEWLGASNENFLWALDMADEIGTYDGPQQALLNGNFYLACDLCRHLPAGLLTPFPNYAKSKAKGLDYSDLDDVHLAYNKYLEAQIISY